MSATATVTSTTWQLQEAKNKFSEVVKRAKETPQTITLRGKPAVVVIDIDEYRKLKRPKMTFLELMATCPPGAEELDLERDRDATMRPVNF